MGIPDIPQAVWADVLKGKKQVEFDFIAARMLVVRLRMVIGRDPAALAQCCAELKTLLANNGDLASVQRDVAKLQRA